MPLRNASRERQDYSSVTASVIRTVFVAAIFAMVIPAACDASAKPSEHSAQGAAQILDQEDLLWWLPADTESVVAARGPFLVPIHSDQDEKDDDRAWFTKKASQFEIAVQFEQLPLELFIDLQLDKQLQGSSVALAMQGSRHFRDPLPGLEVMDYEGCSIVVFENDLGTPGEKLMRTLGKKATRKDTVAETPVLIFHDKLEQAEWDYFLALPRPNVLLVANSLPYLREVLERIAEKKIDRALPSGLPEWSFLDPSVRFWGLRHYDRSQAKEDVTSPFHGVSSDDSVFLFNGDAKAIGLLFTLDPRNQKGAVMTYFSGDDTRIRNVASAGTHIARPQDGVKFEVKLGSPQPGVLQYICSLDRSSALDYFILTEEIALGRGMYL
jgi:hypothetical protein